MLKIITTTNGGDKLEQNNKQNKNISRNIKNTPKTPDVRASVNKSTHPKNVQKDNKILQAQQKSPSRPTSKSIAAKPTDQVNKNKRVTILREERIRLINEENERLKRVKRARLEYIRSALTLFGVSFAIFALIFAITFYIVLTSHKDPDARDYTLELADYENSSLVENGSVVGPNGIRYVNFSKLAEFYGFAMVGSIDNMKYVVKSSDNETVSFTPDSDKVFVNNVAVRADGPAFYNNGDLFVCESFVSKYILGFDLETDIRDRKVTVSRILLNTVDADGVIADGKPPEYEDLTFTLKAPVITASISENDSAVAVPTFEFISSLNSYEEYMNPGSTTEFLTLVNQENKLSADYIPTGLSLLKYGSGMYLKEYAAKAFEAMMKEANACGITGLTVTRAYVSYEEALTLYNEVVDEYVNLLGRDQANRYAAATVSVPGSDEHQTGLAVDLGITTGGDFSRSTAYAWLCDNSYKFGFVLRYPLDKTDATNRVYAPEQFRYVGRYHAVRMNALGLTLDEYAEYLGI